MNFFFLLLRDTVKNSLQALLNQEEDMEELFDDEGVDEEFEIEGKGNMPTCHATVLFLFLFLPWLLIPNKRVAVTVAQQTNFFPS